MDASRSHAPRSVMGIVGLVLAIIAAATSFMPIVNNFSFFLALISAILSLVAVISCARGKKSGKGVAIAGLVVSIISIVVVLATQSMYSAAIDDAVNGPDVSGVSTQQGGDDPSKEDDGAGDASNTQNLAVGTSIDLESGLSVTVDAVDTSIVNYDGSALVGVQVTYVNNSDNSADYNMYDWKGEDAQGAQENSTLFSDDGKELSSGSLAPGGTKTGFLYFKEGTVKALYFSSVLSDDASASWSLA